MLGVDMNSTLARGLMVALVFLCVMSLASSSKSMAQDQGESEAQRLINQANSISGKGLGSITQEEASSAIGLYEEACALDPESFSTWNYTDLADLYNFIGNRDRAVEICHQLLSKEPYDGMALLTVTLHFIDYGRLDEAESLAYKVIAIDNKLADQAGAYMILSRIYRQQGQDEMADWAESMGAKTRNEAGKQMDEQNHEYFISREKAKPYEYPIAVVVYLTLVSLAAWTDYYYRRKKGIRMSFRRDALLLCTITMLLSSPYVIIYPWVGLISIPVAMLALIFSQIGVLTIVAIMHYRIKVESNASV